RPRLSIGNRQSVIACIARLESLKGSVRGLFVHIGAGHGLRWREIETAFESRILTAAVINSNHIEPRRFLEDASKIVIERVQCIMQRYTCCLNDAIEMMRRQSCIRSKLHEVYTVSKTKIALSLHDDKRYIVSGSTDTLPWGHYRCK
ncbi:hypothetical protein ALC57_05148, partial [Trachymyrmex cornetzi]